VTGYFVTGTDTAVGKTLVSSALLIHFRRQGRRPGGMKPVAAGAEPMDGEPRNADAEALRRLMDPPPPYERVNPYLFEPPIAPHIAAHRASSVIDLQAIRAGFRRLSEHYDPMIVEGAGGWLVPLGPRLTMADLASSLGLPVILVVPIRLGCINHCLLTAASIRDHHLPLAGWVATYPAPYGEVGDEVIASLRARVAAPHMGTIPYLPDVTVEAAATHLDWTRLVS